MKSQYGDEQNFIISTFQQNFVSHQNQSIVLYGIGKNTEAVLLGTKGFHFIGLMDQAATGEIIYNYKVLSEEEVIEAHPIIVIIARQFVVNIIYKRIRHLNKKHNILIYDFQGKVLGEESLSYQNENLPYWNASEQELLEQIKEHDIITFDIFDTLLMRRVLQPEDVFELVEIKLRKQGYDYPFKIMRLKAEQLSNPCSNLDEIYANLQKEYNLDMKLLKHMLELECQTDSMVLLRREKMCQIFQLAIDEGKLVYLLSDMYYSKKYMEGLLYQNGIIGYEGLFVSCDIKKEKSDGSLYQWFLSCVSSGKLLHVGDNRRADVIEARKYNIDTYQIYSAYELLMASSIQDILSNADNLKKRCVLGLFVSKIFNNPFALHSSKGYLKIDNCFELGYCFVAPMLIEFMKWFILQVKKNEIQQILFPSRDGYLIKKLYELMSDSNIKTIYFRTSRRAVTVANIQGKDDIQKIAFRNYHGTYENFLKSRFGVDMEIEDSRRENLVKGKQEIKQVLEDYENRILQNARVERKQYVKYLDENNIITNKKQALFDFVAGGTVQYHLKKLLNQNILGLYFATLNLPNNMYFIDTKEIVAAYGNITSYNTHNNVGKYYLFLETILIDDKKSFSHINVKGQKMFEKGSAKSNYHDVKEVQDAVLKYAENYQKYFSYIDFETPELEFTDELFGRLFSSCCIVTEKIKNIFVSDDIYDGVESYSVWSD